MELEKFILDNWEEKLVELEEALPIDLFCELIAGIDPLAPGWHPDTGWFLAYCGSAFQLIWKQYG